MMSKKGINRRQFILQGATAAAAFTIIPRFTLGGKGFIAPSDTLYVAGIGVGGKGETDLVGVAGSPDGKIKGNPKAKISFLCDVDDRQAVTSRKNFPEAKYYKDYRELMDKEAKNFDAVTVTTPDHMHAVIAMAAMQRGKHVYLQKPLTHDIYEARMMSEAAKKYKVVTQMGNQFGSADHVRTAKEYVDAGLIGNVTKVITWTNRPVWPQGLPWPKAANDIPKELDWNLWLGTAPQKNYVENLIPFNWRGWWDYGTGALGDMACHIMDAPFRILPIDFPSEVECSTTTEWADFFVEANYPDSCPASSIIHMKFPRKDGKGIIDFTWMDGGLLPNRPEELLPDERLGDSAGGYIFEGTKGKLMGNYATAPVLLPTKRMKEDKLPKQTIPRIAGQEWGHYTTWVDACIAGYGKMPLASSFDFAGPMTEAVLMGNLALRSYAMKNGDKYPGRKKLLWDAKNMKITNFDEANQFVKREYRAGWSL
ncbi:MAG: Gfo/Idh/MocA family oxidoreductase [Bacteroidota bacterium]